LRPTTCHFRIVGGANWIARRSEKARCDRSRPTRERRPWHRSTEFRGQAPNSFPARPTPTSCRGFDGADTLRGLAGTDVLVGGDANDTVEGGEGNDVITGDAGADTLRGGDDYDLFAPGAGNDSVDGGDGRDIIAVTGQFLDYRVEEITAPSDTAPGSYRLVDERPGAPEGTDTFTGVETLRFELGGEVSLADALDRAPTGVALARTPTPDRPEVSEKALPGTVVAVLSGIDPDPDEQYTFTLVDASGNPADAGGRFAIDRDLLVVGSTALDFETAASHTITVRVADGVGNFFDKQVTVDVRDSVDEFTSISAVLPSGASGGRLWELDDGGFIITWFNADLNGFFARRVDDGGARVDPQGPDRLLMAAAVPSGDAPPHLFGVDDEGMAVFVQNARPSLGGGVLFDKITWVDALTGELVRSTTVSSPDGFTQSTVRDERGFTISSETDTAAADSYFFDDGYIGYRAAQDSERQRHNDMAWHLKTKREIIKPRSPSFLRM
jgi:hypothetical protein